MRSISVLTNIHRLLMRIFSSEQMKRELEKLLRYALSQPIYRKSETVHNSPNAVTGFQELEAIRDTSIGIAEIPIVSGWNIS